jgi:hypothetical protein
VLHSTRRIACPLASIGRFTPLTSARWPEPIAGARQIAPAAGGKFPGPSLGGRRLAPEAGYSKPMPVASVRIRPGSPFGPQVRGIRPGSPVAGGWIPGPVAAA